MRRMAIRWRGALVMGLLALAGPAWTQAIPPAVRRLPELVPTDTLERTVDGVLDQDVLGRKVLGELEPRQVRELRQRRVRELLRRHREVLEADPLGAPMVRSEIVALSPTAEALQRAGGMGFSVGGSHVLEDLQLDVVILQAPPGMTTRRALQQLRRQDPAGSYDFNHIYLESGTVAERGTAVAGPGAESGQERVAASGAAAGKVGLIDGGVLATHAVFAATAIRAHGCDGKVVPTAHGTAVASLLVGQAEVFHGALPGAELFAADVYCGAAAGGAVTAIADAFAWLVREGIPVINVSLVGPPNVLLERLIRFATARGHIVVAAVGNDGPNAPPLFPAAYPEVIAVTGVDARRRVLLEASRGSHVDFAAPGANMAAAGLGTSWQVVRGTSFAAPLVAGSLARLLNAVDKDQAHAAVTALAARAIDLGAAGLDKVYGHGLVAEELRTPEALASSRRD